MRSWCDMLAVLLEEVRVSKKSNSAYRQSPCAPGFGECISGDIGFPGVSDILKKEGGGVTDRDAAC